MGLNNKLDIFKNTKEQIKNILLDITSSSKLTTDHKESMNNLLEQYTSNKNEVTADIEKVKQAQKEDEDNYILGQILANEKITNETVDNIQINKTEIVETKVDFQVTTDAINQKVETLETTTVNITDLAKAMAGGKMLYTDPTFKKGMNEISTYNNNALGTVELRRIEKIEGLPTSSTHCLEIKTLGTASPGWGGFSFRTPTKANQIFITRIIAKIPSGRVIDFASNPTGDNTKRKWLTPNNGTGKWEEYIYQIQCGETGVFQSTNYFFIRDGSTPTASNPLVWYLAYATVYDITDSDESINELTERVKTAEQNTTEDAITGIVRKTFYSKSDIDAKKYQTESQVQQTVNGLEIKVSESGGYNLLYNGDFRSQFAHWVTIGNGVVYVAPGGMSCPNGTGIRIDGEIGVPKVARQVIKCEGSLEPFTLSLYRHTGMGTDGNNAFRGVQVIVTYTDDTKAYPKIPHQANFDKWERATLTILPTKRLKTLTVELYNRDTSRKVYYSAVMIEKGKLAHDFSPNPNEVSDGVTNIDKNGVKVTHSDINGYARMGADGFFLNKGDEDVFRVNSNGAYFKGVVNISGGSVPDSVLSDVIKNGASAGTSAKDTLDSKEGSWDSAKTTADEVNKTVNDNKTNWNNAYNRVLQWAYGAIGGSTTINGGLIQTNTILAKHLAADSLDGKTIRGGQFFTAADPTQTDGYAFRIYSDGRVYSKNYIQVYGKAGNGIYSMMKDGIVTATEYMQAPGIKTSNSVFTIATNGVAVDGTGENAGRIRYRNSGGNYYFDPHYNGTVRNGSATFAWNILYAKGGVNTTSDRNQKENIIYLNHKNTRSIPIVSTMAMYDFIKNDYLMAQYNYKGDIDVKISAVAQDLIVDQEGNLNKIGNLIINNDEVLDLKKKNIDANLSINQTQLLNVTIGALQESMNKIDKLERRIEELEKNTMSFKIKKHLWTMLNKKKDIK